MSILTAIDVVDWSRAQFAPTAMYHWLFVPLTLGLGFICAFMETIYLKRGQDPEWKKMTKFWMRLFAINFAIGIATGLILEFEFGTNWSNYSYFVGDIFGAPLAIEGIFAFFMESTFFAVMFFGWDKVSPRFHLASTWLTAIGANISALWILVANGWMQYPTGMAFNVETARNEMVNFWDIISDVALVKFGHSVTSGFVLASVFVVGISAWFLLKKRNTHLAEKSMKVAAIFGLISSIAVVWTGDASGIYVAKHQPMKLASMEALYQGSEKAPLSIVGILNPKKEIGNDEDPMLWDIKVNGMLSFLAFHDVKSFVPGINDLVYGNTERDIMSTAEKMERGKVAIEQLRFYKEAIQEGDTATARSIVGKFDHTTAEGQQFLNDYFKYFGYGYLSAPTDIIPNIALTFYGFRIMVALGLWFILLFTVILILLHKQRISNYKWWLWVVVWSIPLPYIAGQAGWVVTEVGRQPWTIQDLLPTVASISSLDAAAVKVTFFLFAVLFTILLIAEIRIMLKQIKIGPKE